MIKYLGIDLGSKSLGLAISESGIIANSFKTLYFEEDNYDLAANIITGLIISERFNCVVVGLPKHMNNDIGIRGNISIDFANKLKALNPSIDVVLVDERSSTKIAIKTMISANVSRKKQKTKKDELAAVIILQNYLDSKENRK